MLYFVKQVDFKRGDSSVLAPKTRVYAYVVAMIVLTLIFTLFTPPPRAHADNLPLPVGTYVGPTVLKGLAARHSIDFVTYKSPRPADYTGKYFCGEYVMDPWVMLLNKDTGEQFWTAYFPPYTNIVSFGKTDTISYPGATVQAFMYNRDPYNCNVRPDFNTATPDVVSEEVKLTWEPMHLFDGYMGEDSSRLGSYKAKVTTDLHSSFGQYKADSILGGISSFAIKDYGKPTQQVLQNSEYYGGQCVYESPSSSTCTAEGVQTSDVVGFALIPNKYPRYSGTVWPPPGTIDSEVVLRSEVGGPPDVPVMTKAGASESARCYRVCTGDPIDSYSGIFFERKSDLSISGRIGIDITRSYSSGTSLIGAFGKGWSLGYDMKAVASAVNSKVSILEPSGNESPFTLDANTNEYRGDTPVLRASIKKTATGWEFSRWNESTTYHFDDLGVLKRISDTNGNEVTIEHDSTGKVTKVVEGSHYVVLVWSGERLISAEDHTGRTVSYTYDPSGQLSGTASPEGSEWAYGYDSLGRVTAMTNPTDGVTSNIYDSQGRVSQQTLPSGRVIKMAYGAPDIYGHVTNTETSGTVVKTLRYIKGRISSISDSSNIRDDVWYYYNNTGDLVSVIYADDTVHRVKLAYDGKGNIVSKEDTANSAREVTEWNDRNQATKHVDATGLTTANEYDNRGNLLKRTETPPGGSPAKISLFEVSSSGEIVSSTNALGGNSTMTYTEAGELISVVDSVGRTTTFDSDQLGRVIKKVSPGGNESEDIDMEVRTYDHEDRVVSVKKPTGETAYEYDAMGRPVAIRDAQGKTKNTSYSPDGDVTSIKYPDGSTDLFSYDPATGALATWTDSKQRVTRYTQNGARRTTIMPDGSSAFKSSSAVWDMNQVRYYDGGSSTTDLMTAQTTPASATRNNGIRTDFYTYDVAGRITSDVTDLGDGAYKYDGFGNLTSITSSTSGRNVSYQYDIEGNITRITYPDGTSVSRAYDTEGRLTRITDWVGTTYDTSYDANGNLSRVSSSTGLSYREHFEGLRSVKKEWTGSGDEVIADFESSYDSSGALASNTNSIQESETSRPYTWNTNGSLTGSGEDSFNWDGKSLVGVGGNQLDYDALSGRLKSTSSANGPGKTFSYDARGNRTSMTDGITTTNYAWDRLNRMVSAGNETYAYGIDGLRTKINNNNQVYDQGTKLLSDGLNKYLWDDNGNLLSQAPLGTTVGGSTQQVISDSYGTVHAIVKAAIGPGTPEGFSLLASYAYSPFGERTLTSGSNISIFGFMGEQHDNTGLIYLRSRYYDPSVGQFISADPLARITLDPYGYGATNPIQITDPLGLSPNGLDLISTPLSVYDNFRTAAEGETALQSALADHVIEAIPGVSSVDSLNSSVKSAKKNDIVGTLNGVFGVVPGARYLGLASRLSKNGGRLLDSLEKVQDFEDGLGVLLGLPFKSEMITPDYCAVAFV